VNTRMRVSVAVMSFSLAAAGGCSLLPDRMMNAAPKVHSFPESTMPNLHGDLIAALRSERPFSDKEVKRIAVPEDWGPWFQEGGVDKQAIRTVVGVYDPQNSKCWVWNQVYFSRPRDGRVLFSTARNDVNEIDCSLIGR
jgi:hypothetical protein